MTFVTGPVEPGGICEKIGHEDQDRSGRCSVCKRPATYVRVEVEEGRAYTYLSFEDSPLRRGDWVRLPGNAVHKTEFAGKVLRTLDGPDKGYDGPYKAVLGRLL